MADPRFTLVRGYILLLAVRVQWKGRASVAQKLHVWPKYNDLVWLWQENDNIRVTTV
jgi:hypothetical protein